MDFQTLCFIRQLTPGLICLKEYIFIDSKTYNSHLVLQIINTTKLETQRMSGPFQVYLLMATNKTLILCLQVHISSLWH